MKSTAHITLYWTINVPTTFEEILATFQEMHISTYATGFIDVRCWVTQSRNKRKRLSTFILRFESGPVEPFCSYTIYIYRQQVLWI